MAKTIYKDRAGNRLVKRYIKSRKVIQLTGYNRSGRLVNTAGINQLIRNARLRKIRW